MGLRKDDPLALSEDFGPAVRAERKGTSLDYTHTVSRNRAKLKRKDLRTSGVRRQSADLGPVVYVASPQMDQWCTSPVRK